MYFLKFIIFLNHYDKKEIVLYNSNFEEKFHFNFRKRNELKIIGIFKNEKKIFFHAAFPIISHNSISKKKKTIDCFYEIKFEITIKKKKKKWLIGKLNKKKNLINIFSISKLIEKFFPSNLKKKFLRFSPFCANFKNLYDVKKKDGKFGKKQFFKNKNDHFYFFNNFHKISIGLKDYFLNLDCKFKKKTIFFKKFSSRVNVKKVFSVQKKKMLTFKNFLFLLYRSVNEKINLLSFDFIKKKNSILKGIILICFTLGFFFRNFFVISSSIIFKKFSFFNLESILFDFSHQMFAENDFKKNQLFPFSIESIVKSYLKEKIKKKSGNNFDDLGSKKNSQVKLSNKLFFLKKNEYIWNKKKSLSEIQSNLFLKKFFKKKKKFFFVSRFSFFFKSCLQSLLVTISLNAKFFSECNYLDFSQKKKEKIQNRIQVYSYKNWGNLDLDFNFFKYKKMYF